jgi:hypothetical protein
MTLELNNYGLELDTNWCYVALSWQLLITATLLVVAYKIYKRKKNK